MTQYHDAVFALRTPGTKVFLASGWKQREFARKCMDTLVTTLGVNITRDWTKETMSPLQNRALGALAAVKEAQVLVAVMTLNDYEYKGTFTEIGIALGANIPVIIVSPFRKYEDAICARNVYFHMPTFARFTTLADLVSAVKGE
jgi:hypothetical protein